MRTRSGTYEIEDIERVNRERDEKRRLYIVYAHPRWGAGVSKQITRLRLPRHHHLRSSYRSTTHTGIR